MAGNLFEAIRSRAIMIVPSGGELNYGPSEDSDSEIRSEPVEVEVLGPAEGAFRVRIIGPDGKPQDHILYFHHP